MLDRFAMSKVPNDRSYVFFRILEQVYIGYWLVTYDLPGGGGGVGGGGGGGGVGYRRYGAGVLLVLVVLWLLLRLVLFLLVLVLSPPFSWL